MIEVMILKSSGETETKNIDGSLKSMQEIVGGLIEPIYLGDKVMIVDEEGLCKEKPYNGQASIIAERVLVGDAFIMSMKDWETMT